MNNPNTIQGEESDKMKPEDLAKLMKDEDQLSDGERWYLHSQTGSIWEDIVSFFKSLFNKKDMKKDL